ncbi:MAG TPA: hypothetical protein VJZ26_02460 [Blastocatellia bacterium]|nr:hypothetical protein [Blastocatellia bacterium]
MKVCPVCNESFEDDLKFCDLDGTRLTRDPDAPNQQGQNKLWSMLGIGLLVGALVLSAASVFLIPKARVSPPAASTTPQEGASSSKPANETGNGAAGNTVASATNEQPEIVVTEGAPTEPKKKDKTKSLANENSDSASLNPKAAAQPTEDTEKISPPVETPPAPRKPEPAPAIKPASETREAETAPKPAASTDPKKDPKHQTSDASKDSDKKKGDDKDKKKGGFFRVFKKIFGKD